LKKILLANTNIEKAPYPVPPLGLCLLASALEPQYTVEIYDGVFDEGKSLQEKVLAFSPDYIGFSIRNIDDVVADRPVFYIDRIISDFIEPVRKISSVPIILGGSGFSIFPFDVMRVTGASYGIVGEAEDILPQLLNCLDQGLDCSGIPNVIVGDSGLIWEGYQLRFMKDVRRGLSEIDRRIDFNPYRQKGVYSIQTKRGCSHGCIYCSYPLIEGKKFRMRDPADIAEEIAAASKRLGFVTFEFVDSTFNDPKGHAEAICREIIRRKLKVRLRTMGINPRHASGELFELMTDAGFTQIDATPDTASPRMLKALDKGFNLDEIRKMAELIRQYDLPTMWFFLFGGPGENEETLKETFDFIDEYVNPEDLVYMNAGMRVYPNTPLYDVAVGEGLIRAGETVFHPPFYYYSVLIGKKVLDQKINEAAKLRPNCLPALATVPPPAMIQEALAVRASQNLQEPMFRTLLRIRRVWTANGRL